MIQTLFIYGLPLVAFYAGYKYGYHFGYKKATHDYSKRYNPDTIVSMNHGNNKKQSSEGNSKK